MKFKGYAEPMSRNTKRLTLDFGERSWDRLEWLQDVTEVGTKVGVVQQALQLLEFVVLRAGQGQQVFIRDEAGKVENLAVLGMTTVGTKSGNVPTEVGTS